MSKIGARGINDVFRVIFSDLLMNDESTQTDIMYINDKKRHIPTSPTVKCRISHKSEHQASTRGG